MTSKKQRKKKKSFRWSLLLPIFLLAFGAFNFGQEYINYLDLKGEVNYYQERLDTVNINYSLLQEEKALLFNDSYIEKMARENLGMIKEGETLILPMVQSDVLKLKEDGDIDENIH